VPGSGWRARFGAAESAAQAQVVNGALWCAATESQVDGGSAMVVVSQSERQVVSADQVMGKGVSTSKYGHEDFLAQVL